MIASVETVAQSVSAQRVTELACYRTTHSVDGGSYELSGGRTYHEFPSTVVRVTAEDGTTGFGESSTMGSNYLEGFPKGTEATVRELAPVVLSCDPLQPLPLVRTMDRALVGHHPGKAAIDIAMWDLRARLLGVPVAVLLGGPVQSSLDAFTAIPLVESTDAAIAQAQALVALGYRRLQIKVGGDPLADARRVRALAGEVGESLDYLSCDANSGWTTAEARRFARAVDDLDIYLEQPCASIGELAELRSSAAQPIFVDEAARHPRDLLDALNRGCVDGVNLKPTRVGGLTKAARMREIAHSASLMMLVDEPMGGLLATAAIAHLGATIAPELLLAVTFFGDHQGPQAAGGPQFQAGRVNVPRGPGLGVIPEDLGEPVFVVDADDVSVAYE